MRNVYTVFAKETPSRPGLGVGLALASLAGALALGFALGRYKEQRVTFTLASRIAPAGWPISFRIPDGFTPYSSAFHARQSDDLVYSDGNDLRAGNTLFVGRRPAGRVRPPTWIASFQPPSVSDLLAQTGLQAVAAPEAREFGPLPGAELRYRVGRETIRTRIGVCPDGTVVYASLIAAGGSSRTAAKLLDDVVASVELTRGAFAPADASLPFALPKQARCTAPVAASSRPRFQVFSSPADDQGFWHAEVYEIDLADGRSPGDVLVDTARVHLSTTHLTEPAREKPGSPTSWRMPGPPRLDAGVRYEFCLREFEASRAVVVIGTALERSEPEMREAVDKILASYQPSPTETTADDDATSVVGALPADLAARLGEGTRETWYLLYNAGTLEGYVRSTAGAGSMGETLEVQQEYVRRTPVYALSGRYDAMVAADLQSYELDDATRVAFAEGPGRSQTWKERRAPGEDVSRLYVEGPAPIRTGGTFAPPPIFVPPPAFEEAALRVARRGTPVTLITTNANLAVGPIGVRVRPIDVSTLDWSHLPEASLPLNARHAVRIEEDCEAESDVIAFDDAGHVIAHWIGDALLLVEGSEDEAQSAFRDSPQIIAVPGKPQ